MSRTSAKAEVTARELVEEARRVLPFAYAPYSHFPVAAAVIDDRGRVFTGVNVENASYGLTICAERAAIFSAVASGAKRIKALAIVAGAAEALEPCGACRQVLAEFADPDSIIYSGFGQKGVMEWTLAELLPSAFTSRRLDHRPE